MKFEKLTPQQQEALSYLAKNEAAYREVVALLDSGLTEVKRNYETAKETLVVSGENRPICLQLRGSMAAFEAVIEIFKSIES